MKKISLFLLLCLQVILFSCITVYKPEKCWNGYTLLTGHWGVNSWLIDMEGNIVIRSLPVRTGPTAEVAAVGQFESGQEGLSFVEYPGFNILFQKIAIVTTDHGSPSI